MRKTFLLIVLILITMVFVFAQSNARIMEGLSMTSKILGQDLKYSIILPEEYYSTKKSYPVVFLLHGLGDNESAWLEYGRVSQSVDAAVRRKEIIPMIYVIPQGFRSYYVNDYAGKFKYEDMFINELVPFIDKQYRTIPNTKNRATMGYSMGGFGALILPVRNPKIFSVSVTLSISVRTDKQYMTEDASGWNDQWGRLFGGEGTIGKDRITEYYKQHSPFHIFAKSDLSNLKDLKIFIDNGDDEETLCRSNEELHMLLRDRNFPHEFRVRNGGHEFSYWRDALNNGLRFISDSFEGKAYRSDQKELSVSDKDSTGPVQQIINSADYSVLVPSEYGQTQRLYPVLYFMGSFDQSLKEKISKKIHSAIEGGLLPPVLVVFLKADQKNLIDTIIPSVEKAYRARSGWRFRSLVGFEEGGVTALNYALTPETFTSCSVFDAALDCDQLKKGIAENKKALSRTWYFISTTDESSHYKNNGCAHTLLRDEDVYHEYRVQEGAAGEEWFINALAEALDFSQRKIHR